MTGRAGFVFAGLRRLDLVDLAGACLVIDAEDRWQGDCESRYDAPRDDIKERLLAPKLVSCSRHVLGPEILPQANGKRVERRTTKRAPRSKDEFPNTEPYK
jgi:hypothetical protein